MHGQISILPQNEYTGYHIERIKINPTEVLRQGDTKGKQNISLSIFGESHDISLDPTDVMSSELAQAYPTIQTFKVGTKNGKITGRATSHSNGIFMQLQTTKGLVTINPDTYKGDMIHRVEIGRNPELIQSPCKLDHHKSPSALPQKEINYKRNTITNGSIKRTYSMVITTPYEFYELTGSSSESNIAGIVASVNALEEVYENELAVNFELLPPIIFTTEDDPYDESSFSFTEVFGEVMLDNYDQSEFDVGHFLGPVNGYNGGGYAALGALCTPALKTVGYTGGFNGVYFDFLNTFAHEVGHQFGANHTFNGNGGGCTAGNHSARTAVELGSGSTIMSYNGLCSGSKNTDRASSHFFHSWSVGEIIEHMERVKNRCSQLVEEQTGNEPPRIDVDECDAVEATIPQQTAFMLTGESTDDGGRNKLNYNWEQIDPGTTQAAHGLIGDDAALSKTAPLFETTNPSQFNMRFFPEIKYSLGSTTSTFQVSPATDREMNFNMVTRDNQEGAGGMSIQSVKMNVAENGPFTLDSLSENNLNIDDELTIYWSTNGTEDICDNLGIYLSLNNGLTFGYKLAGGIPYADGEATITIPHNVPRVTFSLFMLGCDDYQCVRFYDLHDGPVRINTTCPTRQSRICDDTPLDLIAGSEDANLEIDILLGNNLIILGESSCRAPSGLGSTLGYSFIAVDSEMQTVQAVKETGDFSDLAPGTYQVYGIGYKIDGASPPASLDPTSWIGTALNDIVNDGTCTMLSDNYIPLQLTIENCVAPLISLGEQSVCDTDTQTFSQEISVIYDDAINPEFIVVNDTEYNATGSPQTVILEGLTGPDPIDVEAYLSGFESCSITEVGFIKPPLNCDTSSCGIRYESGPTELEFRPMRCLYSPPNVDDIRDSEAYVITSLVKGRGYTFSFCEMYDEQDAEANVVILEYNYENGIIGTEIARGTGCTYKFVLDQESPYPDIIIIVTANEDCSGTSQGINFGAPTFLCNIGRGEDILPAYPEPTTQVKAESEVYIYPNPAYNVVNIDGVSSSDYNVTIYDVTGSVQAKIRNANKIDVTIFNSGIYFIEILDLESDHKWIKKCTILK